MTQIYWTVAIVPATTISDLNPLWNTGKDVKERGIEKKRKYIEDIK